MTPADRDTLYVGLDVERSACKFFAADVEGRIKLRRSVDREELPVSLPRAARTVIGLEYRSSAHELAFALSQAGFDVRLIRSRDIPWSKELTGLAAFDCAEALCEAVRTTATRPVPILAPDQRGREASQRVKALLKRQRSAILNAARTITDRCDADQRLDGLEDQDVEHRLGLSARTGAYRRASSALLQVLFVLEANIASLDEAEPEARPSTEAADDRGGSTARNEDPGSEPDANLHDGGKRYAQAHLAHADRPSGVQLRETV